MSIDDEQRRLEPADDPQRFGSAAAEDAEIADRAVADAGGDEEAAERSLEDSRRGPVRTVPGGADAGTDR